MPARQAVISLPISQTYALERFESVERLSELFVIEADVLCEEPVDFLECLGKATQITVAAEEGPTRSFSGIVFGVELIDDTTSGSRYRLTLRPWLYALSRNLDFVIFQQQSVKEILQSVFSNRGCNDVDFDQPDQDLSAARILRAIPRERLPLRLAADGRGRHLLLLQAHRGTAQAGALRRSHVARAKRLRITLLHSARAGGGRRPGVALDRVGRQTGRREKATFRSFDFTRPRQALEGHPRQRRQASRRPGSSSSDPFLRQVSQEAEAGSALPAPKVEIYDFPADFLDDGRGETLAETAMLATYRFKRSYRGEGDATQLACGRKLTVGQHTIERLNQEYLIAGLTYSIRSGALQRRTSSGTAAATSGKEPVIVEILATPIDQPWRAPRITEKPVALGPETAIVTGQPGDTIYTDKYGRVKVQFPLGSPGQRR